MRTSIFLCAISAAAGGLLALGIHLLPIHPQTLAAAEPAGNDPVPAVVRGQDAAALEELTPEERVNVAVYENVNRSVVNIVTKIPGTAGLLLFDNSQEGAGSGSVLDKKGDVLTNFHVIEGAREIQVTLYDGSSYEARLVGRDVSSDIAVLKIDAPPEILFPVRLGDSAHLLVGQRVLALGNPFGLERTLTTGIISSVSRSLPARNNRVIKSVIQTDAAINPGNSGGPLLDSHGRLIGMNTAIASRNGQNTGVGFAIPSNIIARVTPQLIANGHVIHPETGITRVYQTEKGLYVATMAPGGPAETAGLRGFKVIKQKKKQGPFTYETETVDRNSADLIIGVGNQKTLKADVFLDAIENYHPGDEAPIHIIRDGREMIVNVRLAAAES